MGEHDDPVARNRAQHPRRTPGRTPAGWDNTRRWIQITAIVVLVATAALIGILATAR